MTTMIITPNNLEPLPDYDWKARPEKVGLTFEEVRTALWTTEGNMAKAAEMLLVRRSRLERFVRMHEYLDDIWYEIREQMLDLAQRNVKEALNDRKDPDRQLRMARFVLSGNAAKERGWGRSVPQNSPPNGPQQSFPKLVWSDGEPVT
jgi:hypothetical protein